jgi:hypothetical protein
MTGFGNLRICTCKFTRRDLILIVYKEQKDLLIGFLIRRLVIIREDDDRAASKQRYPQLITWTSRIFSRPMLSLPT